MAFYTPPFLPRTPSDYTMNATLPSLPTELLSSWSMWRHPKHQQAPITPPMTSTFETRTAQPNPRVVTTLPPITHFDRHIPHLPPLTPPDDEPYSRYSPEQTRLPPIKDTSNDVPPEDIFQSISSDKYLVDWLDFTRTRSAHFIAEKTCEMICYLWFSSPSPTSQQQQSDSSPPFSRSAASTTTLQLVASPTFVSFMQKLLETTQVSQSVIVLSLHYIYRLKEQNRFTSAQSGSEFRIAVAGLMMANKFLDDNTYTNKTWSEVSGIELAEINRMEREFLVGVGFSLYVDKATYESWLNLLKGLVMAKERDSRHFRKSRPSRNARHPHPSSSTGPSSRVYTTKHRPSSRARSSSPVQTQREVTSYSYPSHTYSYPPPPPASAESYSPTPRSGLKRSAEAAFSPTSATFSQPPPKRPVSLSLYIPELAGSGCAGPGANSHSPLEGLQSFAKMSLASSSPHAPSPSHSASETSWGPGTRETPPETLVAAYSLDERKRAAVPQNLYFYTLACSPMEEEENRSRKNRLRYHQPPTSSATPYYPPPPPSMHVVQSASASPHDIHLSVSSHGLPHFHDNVWSHPPALAPSTYRPPQPQSETRFLSHPQQFSESPIPSAPFANAGPPGVHFYPTPVQQSTSVYPSNWSRSRRL